MPTSRDPLCLDRDNSDRSSEYGWGAGQFPDPHFDYSSGGSISRVPLADPDLRDQRLSLAMIKRTDVSNPADVPSPYVAGNTDRYGAQPPLVRETTPPPYTPAPIEQPSRMERAW